MRKFMDKDFLLETDTARQLFHEHGEKMPIIDYHCHIDPGMIASNYQFQTITEVWLGGDHYKWRAMRSCGVPERYITGDASPAEKFQKWAETMPQLIGNPLYHWTHLELQRYFDINEPLSGKNAQAVYQACNQALARPDMSVRGIIAKSNVKLICTTDDPVDDLHAHESIAGDPSCAVKVLPAFRPDKAMNADSPAFPAYMDRLEAVSGVKIDSMAGLRKALSARINYFGQHGCKVSDHALEYCIYQEATEGELDRILAAARQGQKPTEKELEAFRTAVLMAVAREYHARDWAFQIHFGCIRNNSAKFFAQQGPDTGFDAMDDMHSARKLAAFLSALELEGALPKTVLYPLNPVDNHMIGTVMGCFQTDSGRPGKIQMGSAWWFNDHKAGMEKQMTSLMNLGAFGTFIGMLTDSRSFLSYTRHEYFRRILCNLLGNLVESGQYPADMEALGQMVENISYNNTNQYFGFEL